LSPDESVTQSEVILLVAHGQKAVGRVRHRIPLYPAIQP